MTCFFMVGNFLFQLFLLSLCLRKEMSYFSHSKGTDIVQHYTMILFKNTEAKILCCYFFNHLDTVVTVVSNTVFSPCVVTSRT
jgi:hypothetical protein